MAEAFPEESTTSELHDDGSRKIISVLFLASRWQFDTYGLSTVNKSLVNNLRLVDPETKTIKITCAVVEEDGKIKDIDVKEADNYGVRLRGAKRPKGKKRDNKPKVQWLDQKSGAYYLHLQDQQFDFIVGHAPYLANGCFNLKDIYKWREMAPKIILMVHGLPRKDTGDVDDDMLEEWLTEADIVFAVGRAVESELVPYILGLDEEKKPIHKTYIPSYPLELFHVRREPKGMKIEGTQNVTMMSAEFKDLDITGLDFPLAVNATIGAAEHIRDFDGIRTNLTMLAAQEDDRAKWKEECHKICKRRNVESTGLSTHAESPSDTAKLQSYLKRSNLFLHPLRSHSPLFGTEALSAIAAGVPILVSRYSGLASLLRKMAENEPVVYENKSHSAIETWRDRILERLLKPEKSERSANRLREKLLLDTSIAETHFDFINIITKEACVQLQIEILSDSAISEENLGAAIKFGIEKKDAADTKKYLVVYMRKLLHQMKKIDNKLLENYLKLEIVKQWRLVLSTLENKDRKLINIQNGSLIFTLYCPTRESRLQLQDENWKDETQNTIAKMAKLLGAEIKLKLHTTKSIEVNHLTKIKRKLKTSDSENYSVGYATMTTMSDEDSEVEESEVKVEDWLAKQSESVALNVEGQHQLLQIVKTLTLNHVKPYTERTMTTNRFAVSESGTIGISCLEIPSLSVMYPDTDKPPVILSITTIYRSATFVKISGKEYLAAAYDGDGCLYLWNISSKTSKKVFDPKFPKGKYSKRMNIFKINDTTIGYGEVNASSDGSRRVFILQMNTGEWNLTETLSLFSPENIWDVSHMVLPDGTPCLFLCIRYARSIMAVEMVGAKTRWEVGKEEMGEKFKSWSICTDDHKTLFVSDKGQSRIHLLSAADGSIVKSFDLARYDINNIFTVRFHDHYLYLQHKIAKEKYIKYAVTKFKLIKED